MLAFIFITAVLIWAWRSVEIDIDEIIYINGSQAFYDVNQKLFHVKLSPASEWQIPVKLNQMGKWLPLVAVGAEDGRFYEHCGVDFLALMRAAVNDILPGHVYSGASTITSQVIRLAISERQHKKRNIFTKIFEFIAAMKLEKELSKQKILECYLNLAPFGGNIRGVEAASLIYFGKPAEKISRGEACLLIGMLKAPSNYRPDTKPIQARKRRNLIINLMLEKKIFTPDDTRRALLEDLPRKKFIMPSRAWHFAEMVLNANPDEREKIFNTSLNLETQTKLEAVLKQSLNEVPEYITFAAGIVENKTASLIAWVGNSRFGLNNKSSWVDCGRSLRSPGSTLKPFAYLTAIEQGLLTPATLLADTSTAFSGRAPRNFDLQYHGAVTARVALAQSLNAPAVRVLRMAGNERVLSMLRSFGFRHLKQPSNFYGDALILGGCEVTLLEELEAYCTLANLGLRRPLNLLAQQNFYDQFYERVAEPESCWLINDILNYRGGLTLFARGTHGFKWQIALKTGTSHGLRDAWCAVYNPEYTVVVWAGNPEGKSWDNLIGAQVSAPAAIKILRSISNGAGWFQKPEGVILRKVCSISGRPPVALCPAVKNDYAIKNITRSIPCNMHVKKSGGVILKMPAEFKAGKSDLEIISPVPNAEYFIAPFDINHKIPFKAEGAVNKIWWYLDGKYIGASNADKTFFYNVPDGEHTIGVLDSEGRSAVSTVKVSTPAKKIEHELLF